MTLTTANILPCVSFQMFVIRAFDLWSSIYILLRNGKPLVAVIFNDAFNYGCFYNFWLHFIPIHHAWISGCYIFFLNYSRITVALEFGAPLSWCSDIVICWILWFGGEVVNTFPVETWSLYWIINPYFGHVVIVVSLIVTEVTTFW
jgi:hypothetical protein